MIPVTAPVVRPVKSARSPAVTGALEFMMKPMHFVSVAFNPRRPDRVS